MGLWAVSHTAHMSTHFRANPGLTHIMRGWGTGSQHINNEHKSHKSRGTLSRVYFKKSFFSHNNTPPALLFSSSCRFHVQAHNWPNRSSSSDISNVCSERALFMPSLFCRTRRAIIIVHHRATLHHQLQDPNLELTVVGTVLLAPHSRKNTSHCVYDWMPPQHIPQSIHISRRDTG